MITLKSPAEVQSLHIACDFVCSIHESIRRSIQPGVCTQTLENIVASHIARSGAHASWLGNRGFPCVSQVCVNHEVTHALPRQSKYLRDGDTANVGFGLSLDGFFSYQYITYPIGNIDSATAALLTVCQKALERGVAAAQPGNRISDISHAIQETAEAAGFGVVREFVGHGIGRVEHEEPQIPNFVAGKSSPKIRSGMTLSLVPMIVGGSPEVGVMKDGWTVVTLDGRPAACYSHVITVNDDGPQVLTPWRINPFEQQSTTI